MRHRGSAHSPQCGALLSRGHGLRSNNWRSRESGSRGSTHLRVQMVASEVHPAVRWPPARLVPAGRWHHLHGLNKRTTFVSWLMMSRRRAKRSVRHVHTFGDVCRRHIRAMNPRQRRGHSERPRAPTRHAMRARALTGCLQISTRSPLMSVRAAGQMVANRRLKISGETQRSQWDCFLAKAASLAPAQQVGSTI